MNRLLRWLLERSLPPEDREAVMGDLDEELHDVEGRLGPEAARRWLRRQVVRSLGHNLVRRGERAGRKVRELLTGGDGMDAVLQDLRYGFRKLVGEPFFSAVVILTLALGISANTVIFSAVDGVILNPFPYPEPDRLVGVGPVYPKLGRELAFFEVLSPPEFQDIREQSRTLESVVAWDLGHRQISSEGSAENLFTAFWWGDPLATLGMEPAAGRSFLPGELERGDRVALIAHPVWMERYGGDPSAVGSTLAVNGIPHTIVGVLPPRTSVYGTELWVPMGISPDSYDRDRRQMQILARLAPGSTMDEVEAELATIAARIESEYGREFAEYEGWTLEPRSWTDINVRSIRPAGLVLMGSVGFVLLLVCVNVTALLVARAARRRSEIAVRAALGAGRRRIAAQLLTESLALAALGGGAGVALSIVGIRGMEAALSLVPFGLPGTVELNFRVLAFTAAVSLGAGLLFGLLPAVTASGSRAREALGTEGSGSTGSRSRLRLQRAFVGVEVAMAVVLLSGAGLLVNSMIRLQSVDLGFQAENLMTMRLTLAQERYQGDAITLFFQELTERVEALPGVSAVGAGSQFPLITFSRRRLTLEGMETASEGELPVAYTTLVTDGYFDALGIPVRRGRVPGPSDTEGVPLVAAVNEAFAERHLRGRDPLGARFKLGGPDDPGPWFEVVGVVGSTRNLGPDQDPAPEVFASIRQLPGANNQLFLLIRSEMEPPSLLSGVKAEVQAMDPEQPVYAVRSMEGIQASTVGPRRIATTTLTGFALFALLLAAMGIYAVTAYGVAARTREIGVRIALGAGTQRVRRLVLRQSLLPVGLGAAAGVAGALALGGVLSELLFQVRGSDPVTLAGVAVVLGGVALVATWVPARRAAALDPVEALRME